jgi:hypothetical protein
MTTDPQSVEEYEGCLLVAQVVPWKTPLPKDQSEVWATSADDPDFAADRPGRYVPAPGLGESSVVACSAAAYVLLNCSTPNSCLC